MAERHRAERLAIREEDRRREEESRRLAAEEREQARLEAAKRVVQVYPPYDPERNSPLGERPLPPMAHSAAGMAAATASHEPAVAGEPVKGEDPA